MFLVSDRRTARKASACAPARIDARLPLRGISILLLLLVCLAAGSGHAAISDDSIVVVPSTPAARPVTALSETAVAASVAQHIGNTRLSSLADDELGDIGGQAGSLFVSDKIPAGQLTGGTAANFADFTYYRMGMDVKLDMNINIAKLQLGCGGVNDMLTGPGCDLDLDYVSFMGLNAAGDRPATNGPDSVFTMTRPYVELAVKNDGTAQREIVGFKVGAQNVNGALRVGRDYTGAGGYGQEASLTNREHGGTCDPAATTGAGVLNCHSGAVALSGFLAGVEMSAGLKAQATICDALLLCIWPFYPSITLNIDACLGRINFGPCTVNDNPFFIEAGGTRLQNLHVSAAGLTMQANVILPITLSGYGQLILDTRQIHYLLAPNAPDFFLSFQRERVSWPNYEKTLPPNNKLYDICNPAYGQVPTNGRCGSAYSEPANTGWWLSAGNLKLLNILPADRIVIPGTLDLGQLLGALGPNSALTIAYPKVDLIAQRNCYGSQIFC